VGGGGKTSGDRPRDRLANTMARVTSKDGGGGTEASAPFTLRRDSEGKGELPGGEPRRGGEGERVLRRGVKLGGSSSFVSGNIQARGERKGGEGGVVILMSLNMGEVRREIPGAKGKQKFMNIIVDGTSRGAERAAEGAVSREASDARKIGERIREVREWGASEEGDAQGITDAERLPLKDGGGLGSNAPKKDRGGRPLPWHILPRGVKGKGSGEDLVVLPLEGKEGEGVRDPTCPRSIGAKDQWPRRRCPRGEEREKGGEGREENQKREENAGRDERKRANMERREE